MNQIEIIKNPWDSKFYELISKVKESFYFTSPFISNEPVENIIDKLSKDAILKGLTFLNFQSIRNNFLNINSLKKIENRGEIKTSRRFLHSKIYIFDNREAIITSANLTNSGLKNNFEYGVLIKDKKIIESIILDFENLFNNKDFGLITKKTLNKIEEKINQLPVYKKEKNHLKFDFDLEYDDKISKEDKNIIFKNLKGWKKELFKIIDKELKEVFLLSEVYNFKDELLKNYKSNNLEKSKNKNYSTIENTIRRLLQELRDLGLLEFLGNGTYRRLWKNE